MRVLVGIVLLGVCLSCLQGRGNKSLVEQTRQRPISNFVAPLCLDGQYKEFVPDSAIDIGEIVERFTPEGTAHEHLTLMFEALEARYPFGAQIVRSSQIYDSSCGEDWLRRGMELWGEGGYAFHELLLTAGLVVHECGHGWDYDASNKSPHRHTLYIGENYSPQVRTYSQDFPRYSLEGDEFSGDVTHNAFDDTYITVDSPTGGNGFVSTLDEWTQYNHSLAVAYAMNDHLIYTNALDGVLALMWYTQRYLYRARTIEPQLYEIMMSDSETRQAILWLWGQSWLLLERALSQPHLGSDESELIPSFMSAIQNPKLLSEIERVRIAEGCIDDSQSNLAFSAASGLRPHTNVDNP